MSEARDIQSGARGATGREVAVFSGLTLALVALLVANVAAGSVAAGPSELMRALVAPSGDTLSTIIWDIRLPRLIAAALEGAALALAGFLLQTFFANPIAGPFVLGISQGAKLAVALAMLAVASTLGQMASWMLIVAATAGSFAVTALVLALSRHVRSTAQLTLAGVMVGYLASAATDFVLTFAPDAAVAGLRTWSLGTFSGTSWSDVAWIAAVTIPAATLTLLLAKPLSAYLLGERHAASVGVDVRRFRVELICLSSVLAALVVAFAGPVSFVGVAVPHIARHLLGTARPSVALPATCLAGAVFCLAADLIARVAFAPTELSVSTVTAVLGAPVALAVLLRRRLREA